MLKRFFFLPLIGLVLGFAGSAQAVTAGSPYLVAGTDFSTFLGSFFADCNGDFVEDTSCVATHSDLDPTNGLGAESAAFGTVSFTNATARDGSLTTLLTLPYSEGQGQFPFDSHTLQQSENTNPGQAFQDQSMVAFGGTGAADFAVNTGGLLSDSFRVHFAALAANAPSGSINVLADFGSGFQVIQSGIAIAAVEQAIQLDVFAGTATSGTVRIEFTDGVAIDNLGVTAMLAVPEPGTLLLMGAGVLGLGAFGRRRRA